MPQSGCNTLGLAEPFACQSLDAPAPDTVNPSWWRQARLNSLHGLFKVTDGIYQAHRYDRSNLSIIEGDSGHIVVDPPLKAEVAKAPMDLVYEHLAKKPAIVVIYQKTRSFRSKAT